MSSQPRTWFITGAARGIGDRIAQAALAAGHNVVATARNSQRIAPATGAAADRLLRVDLDVSIEGQAHAAVAAAVHRFGRIDVLVNNAGYGQLGLFEENSVEDIDLQFATNVFGLFNVTRAVLPTMRRQRGGRIFNVSSIAGIRGSQGASLYCASKHAVEGFSEALSKEVGEFGIQVTLIEPGYFRTDFMDPTSVRTGGLKIADYAAQSVALAAAFVERNHRQEGDPARLAKALLLLADHDAPPLRFAAGSDAVEIIGAKIDALRAELSAWQELSFTTDGKF